MTYNQSDTVGDPFRRGQPRVDMPLSRMLGLEPHHDGSELYVPNQRPSLGDRIEVFARVHRSDPVTAAVVRHVADGEPRYAEATIAGEAGGWVWWRAIIELVNPLTSYRFLLTGGRRHRWLNAAGVHDREVPDATDFKILAGDHPPEWIRDAVAYQVFPDRFARGTEQRAAPDWAIPQNWDDPVVGSGPETPFQWYGGDLAGVAAHLDHLQRIGANVLYLTPIFPAQSNHRYDSTTFERIDPVLGGDEALTSLIRAAHGRGIRVVGDLTTNHTGDRHDWFRRARADASSVEAGFYSFTDHPDTYECWLGATNLPKLDWRSDELRRRFIEEPSSPLRRWLDGADGFDGWRIDVANMTGRHGAVDLTHDVARLVRRVVSSTDPDAWLVAEHMHDAAGDLRLADGWHGTMNYAGFTRPIWTWFGPASDDAWFFGQPGGSPRRGGVAAAATIREVWAQTPWRSLVYSMNILDSHDTPRFGTHAGRDALHAAGGALFAMPGVPTVFAGQELGMAGENGEDARRPIPWDAQGSWDAELLRAYEAYGAARTTSYALRHGGMRWITIDDDALTFVRETRDEQALVHIARSAHDPVHIPRDLLFGAGDVETLFGADLKVDRSELTLPSDGPAAHAWRLPAPTHPHGS